MNGLRNQSQVDRLRREIADLNKADAREAKREADHLTKHNRAQEAAARTKSASTLQSKLREAERATSDLASIRKKRADISHVAGPFPRRPMVISR